MKRKNRNLVSMKFNIINWLLDLAVTVLVVFNKHKFVTGLYIFVISCGTPLVYFMGIEENRIIIRQAVKQNSHEIKRWLCRLVVGVSVVLIVVVVFVVVV